MKIVIEEIAAHNVQHANQCHEPFVVNSALVLNADNGAIRRTIVSVPPYEKRYPPNEVEYTDYIGKPDQTVFFAYIAGELAGELMLRRWWNNFAYIEDVAVKTAFRRRGVGQALMERAIAWAKDRELPGIMLETQNNNVAACQFYERHGFEIRGFDQYLYRALSPNRDEIALYMYLLFRADSTALAAL